MGWWSATVLGGDTPLDFLVDMAFTAGAKDNGPHEMYGHKFDKKKVEAVVPKLEKIASRPEWDLSVGYQVLALVMMSCGAVMTPEMKTKIEHYALQDQWLAEGDKERKFYIDQFLEVLQNYDHTPTVIPTEGLFEKMKI